MTAIVGDTEVLIHTNDLELNYIDLAILLVLTNRLIPRQAGGKRLLMTGFFSARIRKGLPVRPVLGKVSFLGTGTSTLPTN